MEFIEMTVLTGNLQGDSSNAGMRP